MTFCRVSYSQEAEGWSEVSTLFVDRTLSKTTSSNASKVTPSSKSDWTFSRRRADSASTFSYYTTLKISRWLRIARSLKLGKYYFTKMNSKQPPTKRHCRLPISVLTTEHLMSCPDENNATASGTQQSPLPLLSQLTEIVHYYESLRLPTYLFCCYFNVRGGYWLTKIIIKLLCSRHDVTDRDKLHYRSIAVQHATMHGICHIKMCSRQHRHIQ